MTTAHTGNTDLPLTKATNEQTSNTEIDHVINNSTTVITDRPIVPLSSANLTLDTSDTGIFFGEDNAAAISVIGVVLIVIAIILIFTSVVLKRRKRKHSFYSTRPTATNPVLENITVMINMGVDNHQPNATAQETHFGVTNDTSCTPMTSNDSQSNNDQDTTGYMYVYADVSSSNINTVYTVIGAVEDRHNGYYEVPIEHSNTDSTQ